MNRESLEKRLGDLNQNITNIQDIIQKLENNRDSLDELVQTLQIQQLNIQIKSRKETLATYQQEMGEILEKLKRLENPQDTKKEIMEKHSDLRPDSKSSNFTKGKNYLFLIGINAYQSQPKLHNAVKDVQDFKKVLLEKYQFEQDYVFELCDENATRTNIINVLDELTHRKVTEIDNLLIYFSGHGSLNQSKTQGYWIPVDAQQNSTANYIPNSTLKDYLADLKARHVFLISDACFSGSLFVQTGKDAASFADKVEMRKSRWGLCSGRQDETVLDGIPGTNSPFARFLLKYLHDNTEDKFPISKLAQYVLEATTHNYTQLPIGRPFFGVGDEGGEFVFYLKGVEATSWKDKTHETGNTSKNTKVEEIPNQPSDKKELILGLINRDINKALDELDKIFDKDNDILNELNREFISPPNNFSKADFRDKLKAFVRIYM